MRPGCGPRSGRAPGSSMRAVATRSRPGISRAPWRSSSRTASPRTSAGCCRSARPSPCSCPSPSTTPRTRPSASSCASDSIGWWASWTAAWTAWQAAGGEVRAYPVMPVADAPAADTVLDVRDPHEWADDGHRPGRPHDPLLGPARPPGRGPGRWADHDHVQVRRPLVGGGQHPGCGRARRARRDPRRRPGPGRAQPRLTQRPSAHDGDGPDRVRRLGRGDRPPACLDRRVPARRHQPRGEVGQRGEHEQPLPEVAMGDLQQSRGPGRIHARRQASERRAAAPGRPWPGRGGAGRCPAGAAPSAPRRPGRPRPPGPCTRSAGPAARGGCRWPRPRCGTRAGR